MIIWARVICAQYSYAMADNPAKFSGRNELDDKPNSPVDIYKYK